MNKKKIRPKGSLLHKLDVPLKNLLNLFPLPSKRGSCTNNIPVLGSQRIKLAYGEVIFDKNFSYTVHSESPPVAL